MCLDNQYVTLTLHLLYWQQKLNDKTLHFKVSHKTLVPFLKMVHKYIKNKLVAKKNIVLGFIVSLFSQDYFTESKNIMIVVVFDCAEINAMTSRINN